MAIHVPSPSPSIHYSDLQFQPVSQEQDCLFAKNFCLSTLPASERPPEDIVRQIGTNSTVKAELVYQKSDLKKPCGITVYEENPHPKQALTIHVLCTTDDSFYSGKGLSRHMLSRMTSMARLLQNAPLFASVNPLDRISLQFYEGNYFKRVHQTSQGSKDQILLIRDFKNEPPPVRKRLASNTQEPPSKMSRAEQRPLEAPLRQIYLSQIKSGKKTVEGRVASGIFLNVRKGSRIRFFNQTDAVVCKVLNVTKYTSFEELLKSEGVDKCVPGTPSIAEGVRLYDSLPGYKERARANGVLGIQIQVEEG